MDARLERAHAALEAAQDRYAELVKVCRAAQAAYARSRSQKNRAALIAASEACDTVECGPLYDEIERVEAVIAAEQLEREAAADRALQPSLFAEEEI